MTETDYAVAPGEYVAEWVEDQPDLDLDAVAERLQTSRLVIDRLIEGRLELDAPLATRLEGLTGVPTAAWLRYEQQYRADLRRLRAADPRTEQFAAADLPDWDGTWRTMSQDEATMRKRLGTWTKADLITANVVALQRELQLAERGISLASSAPVSKQQIEQALLDATSAETVLGFVRVDNAVRAIAALLASHGQRPPTTRTRQATRRRSTGRSPSTKTTSHERTPHDEDRRPEPKLGPGLDVERQARRAVRAHHHRDRRHPRHARRPAADAGAARPHAPDVDRVPLHPGR